MSRGNVKETEKQMESLSREGDLCRGRSLSIGNAGGGVTELSIRSLNGQAYWYIMQPVEVTELIHQLAANIGCHISLQPREDFGSWRKWNEKNGDGPFPPMANPHIQKNLGLRLEEQPGLPSTLINRSTENDTAMEVKKPNGRDRTKRGKTAS